MRETREVALLLATVSNWVSTVSTNHQISLKANIHRVLGVLTYKILVSTNPIEVSTVSTKREYKSELAGLLALLV